MSHLSQRALRAVTLCRDPQFRLYLDWKKRRQHNLKVDQLPDGTHSEDDARHAVCTACGIKSRVTLGHMPSADKMFDRITADYTRWLRQRQQQRGGA